MGIEGVKDPVKFHGYSRMHHALKQHGERVNKYKAQQETNCCSKKEKCYEFSLHGWSLFVEMCLIMAATKNVFFLPAKYFHPDFAQNQLLNL